MKFDSSNMVGEQFMYCKFLKRQMASLYTVALMLCLHHVYIIYVNLWYFWLFYWIPGQWPEGLNMLPDIVVVVGLKLVYIICFNLMSL